MVPRGGTSIGVVGAELWGHKAYRGHGVTVLAIDGMMRIFDPLPPPATRGEYAIHFGDASIGLPIWLLATGTLAFAALLGYLVVLPPHSFNRHDSGRLGTWISRLVEQLKLEPPPHSTGSANHSERVLGYYVRAVDRAVVRSYWCCDEFTFNDQVTSLVLIVDHFNGFVQPNQLIRLRHTVRGSEAYPAIQNVQAIVRTQLLPKAAFRSLKTYNKHLSYWQPAFSQRSNFAQAESFVVRHAPPRVRDIAHSAHSRIQNFPIFVPRRTLRPCISRGFRTAGVPEQANFVFKNRVRTSVQYSPFGRSRRQPFVNGFTWSQPMGAIGRLRVLRLVLAEPRFHFAGRLGLTNSIGGSDATPGGSDRVRGLIQSRVRVHQVSVGSNIVGSELNGIPKFFHGLRQLM